MQGADAMSSPCLECLHCGVTVLTEDYWAGRQYEDECEEGAPSGVFMSEWGCWRYEERKEYDE